MSVRSCNASRGNSIWETRIWRPFASKPHWSTRNQWKSRSPETCFPGVSRCGKHESEVQTPRNPIGRPGTNGNWVRGRISAYYWLKAQLKFWTHFSSRSRSEWRVDTNIRAGQVRTFSSTSRVRVCIARVRVEYEYASLEYEYEYASLEYESSTSMHRSSTSRVRVCIARVRVEYEYASLEYESSTSMHRSSTSRVRVCIARVRVEYEYYKMTKQFGRQNRFLFKFAMSSFRGSRIEVIV